MKLSYYLLKQNVDHANVSREATFHRAKHWKTILYSSAQMTTLNKLFL